MTLLLFQIAIVVLVTLACGWLATKLGQARVVGEIVGGIVLGPSVFGRFAPVWSQHLFPPASLNAVEQLSTVGLVLFLFTVGLELDYSQFRKQRFTALLSSGTSIVIPFIVAILLAHPLRVRFAPHGIGNLPFVLFLGIGMSITAFPVLARILEERGLLSTPLGTTAILCAAVDDVVAWLLLAVTLTLVDTNGSGSTLAMHFGLLGLYLLIMLGFVRPVSMRLAQRYQHAGLSLELLGVTIVGLFLSAAVTQWAGVHPLFGAFIAGVCFPRIPDWQHTIRARVDMLVSVLLLPLFFALTGLRTRLDLLNDPGMWLWTGIIIAGAVIGKVGGAVLAARWAGQSWHAAGALGALLNTRGLVELIVLNIAYNKGAFSPTLFTMMVVMALLTTMFTAPMLNALGVQKTSPVVEAAKGHAA